MTNLTNLEIEVLGRGIIGSDSHQESGETWVDCIEDYCSVKGRAVSGVVSSLSKKGLVRTDGRVIRATDEGLAAIAATK